MILGLHLETEPSGLFMLTQTEYLLCAGSHKRHRERVLPLVSALHRRCSPEEMPDTNFFEWMKAWVSECSWAESLTPRRHLHTRLSAEWALLLLLLSHFSRVRLCATPWTAAYQAPPSMGFSRQEHWSGLPFPSPGDLPWPRDQTQVSCIGRQVLYHWATREALSWSWQQSNWNINWEQSMLYFKEAYSETDAVTIVSAPTLIALVQRSLETRSVTSGL